MHGTPVFISLGLEGQKQKYEDMAHRKETHGSLILKWFRSQVEQVKQLEGKHKREGERTGHS